MVLDWRVMDAGSVTGYEISHAIGKQAKRSNNENNFY